MSGVILVTLIVVLIFQIGLGIALLIVHKELTDLSDRIEKAETEMNSISADIKEVRETFGADSGSIQDLTKEVSALRKEVFGTADEREFNRLKTQAFITLPKEITELKEMTENHAVKTRIEEQDGFVGKVMVIEEPERSAK